MDALIRSFNKDGLSNEIIPYDLPLARGGIAQLYNNYAHEIILSGPFNCVAGETRIYNPDTDEHVAIQDYYLADITSTVLTRYGKAKATPPFIKGVADLYRVTLANGNTFIATLGHRVLTPDGWRAISELTVSDAVWQYPLTSYVSTITSIDYVRTDVYYDLHVPGFEHYLAEGTWHHNTGKTYGVLAWFHKRMCTTSNAKGLWVRKTYNSLLGSACETFERKILPVPPGHKDSHVTVFGGERPQKYQYSNGGEIVLGGLDKPEKFLSAEFDFIYINQSEEITQSAYEMLTGRCDGRAGNTDTPQILGDCNPSYPGHWIQTRHSSGVLEFYEQLHRDNPLIYTADGQLTESGTQIIANLEKLTGVRRQRGLLGLWVAAEGAIFDNFSFAENVTEDAEYHPDWPVYWGIDDGYAEGAGVGTPGHHPRAFILAQQRPDGGFNVFDEYYRTLQLPEASIQEVLSWPYAEPDMALVDSSAAELRRRLGECGIFNGAASHRVADGIKVMRRYICDGSGVRMLHIHPRCVNLIRELQSYRYDDKSKSNEAGEPKPLKMDDHTIDACRYLLFNFR